MSVSDYIKYKRVGTQLRDVLPNSKKQAPAVFDDQMYIDFKQYTIENTILDSKLVENSLIPTGSNLVFNVLKNVANCPQFPVCKGTDKRTNRVPLTNIYQYYQQTPPTATALIPRPTTSTLTPIPVYWKQKQTNGQVYHNQRPYGQQFHTNNSGCKCTTKNTCKCISNKKISNSFSYTSPRIQYLKYAVG
uniref:Uncharacterized protein n=1 Tax=viral metagenome TaxID=1070528 RepID=A0A6C0B376_9ZZZZ